MRSNILSKAILSGLIPMKGISEFPAKEQEVLVSEGTISKHLLLIFAKFEVKAQLMSEFF